MGTVLKSLNFIKQSHQILTVLPRIHRHAGINEGIELFSFKQILSKHRNFHGILMINIAVFIKCGVHALCNIND